MPSEASPKVVFDHLNLISHDSAKTRRFFSEALGFAPGWRPPFPFPGEWLYRGDDAFVHVVESEDPRAGIATLGHIAFRTDEAPAALIARLRALGYAPEVRRVPERGDTQVFVRLPGGLLVEIDSDADPALRDAPVFGSGGSGEP